MNILDSQQAKLAAHPAYIKVLNGSLRGPVGIEVSISGVCGDGCEHCLYKGRQSGMKMPFSMFKRIVDTQNTLESITITGGGEPTENADIETMIDHARRHGLKIGMYTNLAHPERIPVEHLEWIRVSITEHSIDRDFATLRGCNRTGLCVNYRDARDYNLIDRSLALIEKYNFDYLHVRPVLQRDGDIKVIPIPYLPDHPKLFIKREKWNDQGGERVYDKCEGYHVVPFVWENGDVTVCAYHRNGPYVLGNIMCRRLDEIMLGAPRRYPVVETCQICCKNHDINTLIHLGRAVKDPSFL